MCYQKHKIDGFREKFLIHQRKFENYIIKIRKKTYISFMFSGEKIFVLCKEDGSPVFQKKLVQ